MVLEYESHHFLQNQPVLEGTMYTSTMKYMANIHPLFWNYVPISWQLMVLETDPRNPVSESNVASASTVSIYSKRLKHSLSEPILSIIYYIKLPTPPSPQINIIHMSTRTTFQHLGKPMSTGPGVTGPGFRPRCMNLPRVPKAVLHHTDPSNSTCKAPEKYQEHLCKIFHR